MGILKFAGSKKKARILQRDARRVSVVKKRLGRIYELSRLIKNEDELNVFLSAIPADELRDATRKLIEPFCLFKFRKVMLIGGDLESAPEKATGMVIS